MVTQILALVAACKTAKMTVNRTTKPAPASDNGINIQAETFDLFDSDGQWQGTLSLYQTGAISVEKGGRYNWTQRYNSTAEFKKAMLKKKIA